MAQLEIRVDGNSNVIRQFNKLDHALNRLDWATATEIVDKALKGAAAIPVREAKAGSGGRGFRDKTGRLRQSIKVQKVRKYGRNHWNIIAGGASAPHAHLIERGTDYRFAARTRQINRIRAGRKSKFGTFDRLERKHVTSRGRVEGRDFLSGAVEENRREMLNFVVGYGRSRLAQMARKARRGTGLKK